MFDRILFVSAIIDSAHVSVILGDVVSLVTKEHIYENCSSCVEGIHSRN